MDWEVDILYLMECYDDIRGQKGIAAISVKCRCVCGHTLSLVIRIVLLSRSPTLIATLLRPCE